jgi:chromosome partitioning protein
MGTIVAVVNQKGGVGKTTVVLGLASACLARGRRVLVVDADPQANATWALGIEPETVSLGLAEVLEARDPARAARGAVVDSPWGEAVRVLPTGAGLARCEADPKLVAKPERFRAAVHGVDGDADLVLIDCSPALGALTSGALAAADYALLVMEPSALSHRGIAAVSDLVDHVWEHHNPDLDIAGVILNRVPPVSSEADRQRETLYRLVGKRTVWQPELPQRVIVNEAVAARRPLHAFGTRAAELSEAFDKFERKLHGLPVARR